MKELSIEEKAKRYDRAIEKLRSLHDDYDTVSTLIDIKEELEQILSELKESEDEKIRKTIYNCVKWFGFDSCFFKSVSQEKCLAWLEKQGKETSWKPSKEEMDVLYGLAYITNQYDEHKEEVITRLYQDLKREFFNGSSYENMFPNTEDGVRRRSTIQVLEYARSLDDYNQYGKADIDKNIAWLKKQGEQKPTDEEMKILLQTEYEKGKADAIEQKSTWSEEDEKILEIITSVLQVNFEPVERFIGYEEYMNVDLINWLKSLKERYTWKPSESDILLLERIANGKSNPKDFQASLGGLIGRLKELKGE